MLIRTLTDSERDAVRDFYLALASDDRRKRFCSTLSDDAIASYVDALDFAHHTILGAFSDRAELLGLAELAPGAEASEMAFAVRLDQRGLSIGTALMQRLLLRCRMCGIRKVLVMFLADNTPMRRLATRTGMRIETEGGESFASLELPAPSAEELNQWLMQTEFAASMA
jgi:GNAT superfamily N-acetyltransferase